MESLLILTNNIDFLFIKHIFSSMFGKQPKTESFQ